jgi:predicted metal-dependent hydrolase
MFSTLFKQKLRPIKYAITINGTAIEVEKKNVKNLRLAVYPPDGHVKISAPLFMKDSEIYSFALAKADWIQKHRSKYAGNKAYAPLKYVDGEIHFYLGNPYTLRIVELPKRTKVVLNENEIILTIKPRSTKAQRLKALENWYRDKLNEISPELIAKWEGVIGVKATEFGIKKMKTRWGSCNIRAKRIWLNLDLVRRPLHCLEFIIVHELVHLLERNHNARFKAHMDRFMPAWRTYNKDLTRLLM